MNPRTEEKWIDDVNRFLTDFCCEFGFDSLHHRFRVEKGKTWDTSRMLVLEGLARVSGIPVEEIVISESFNLVAFPALVNFDFTSEERAAVSKKMSKAFACVSLLGLGLNYEIGDFPLARRETLWMKSLCNLKRPDPDYSFLSSLDLTSEEDCLVGLIYFTSISCRHNTKSLYKEYPQDLLMQRTRIVAQELMSQSSDPVCYGKYSLYEFEERILLGQGTGSPSYPRNVFSCLTGSPLSPKEWKKTEKLISFLATEEDGKNYADYNIPDYSIYKIPNSLLTKLYKANIKLMISQKMIEEVLNGKTRSQIIEDVIPAITKFKKSIKVDDAVQIIKTTEKQKAKDSETEYVGEFLDTRFLNNLARCLTVVDSGLNYEDENDKKLHYKAQESLMRFVSRVPFIQIDDPAMLIADMLPSYMEKHPRDVEAMSNCLQIVDQKSVFSGSSFECFLIIKEIRSNRTDEEAVSLLSEAIVFHSKQEKKKFLSMEAWMEIAENNSDYEGMPYEWIYGVLQ